MRVMGVDPGYAIAGYGVVDAEGRCLRSVTFGAVTTPAHTAFEERLAEIYADFKELLGVYQPDAMAIESLFYQNNQKTAIAVAEARGVILLAAQQAGVPIYEYTPLQVKQAVTGYGKAGKKQIQEMTLRLLSLREVPKPDDAADALAIAVCHANSAGSAQFGRRQTRRQQMGYY